MEITECEGYKKLLAAVEDDERRSPGFHDYRGKLAWVLAQVQHYAQVTGLEASVILDACEKRRNYWYMNFYQESRLPRLDGKRVKIFATQAELQAAVGTQGFRCPRCGGVSTSHEECNSGLKIGKNEVCDWKTYGLFGTLGQGVFVFVKEPVIWGDIFTPIAWEAEFPVHTVIESELRARKARREGAKSKPSAV